MSTTEGVKMLQLKRFTDTKPNTTAKEIKTNNNDNDTKKKRKNYKLRKLCIKKRETNNFLPVS